MSLCKLVFAAFFISFSIASAQVWEAKNSWSADWEKKYQSWVEANWQADMFSRANLPNGQRNPYYGLRADCADVVYSMRIIFAYENKLPFEINDPSGGSNFVSNRMTRFNNISDPVKRIRAFLQFVYGIVGTVTLPNDTYPVALSKKTIVPGSLILTVRKNHHSWSIKSILPIGVPHLVFNSRVHAASGYSWYERQSWPNPGWVFEGNQTVEGGAGIRYWRPASHLKSHVTQVPGFSDDQYKVSLGSWNSFVQKKLASSLESRQSQLTRLFKTACEGFQGRVKIVQDGVDYLRKNPACYDYATYDVYSTPNRDRRVFDDLMELQNAYRETLENGEQGELDPQFLSQLAKIFPNPSLGPRRENEEMAMQQINSESTCVVEYASGKSIDMAEAKRRLFAGMMSNNPLDEMEQRWGEIKGPSLRAQQCQSWDQWKPEFGDAGLLAFSRLIPKLVPSKYFIENYHLRTSDGQERRIHIRPYDSEGGDSLEILVMDVDRDDLPVLKSKTVQKGTQIDPAVLESFLKDSTVLFHEKKAL